MKKKEFNELKSKSSEKLLTEAAEKKLAILKFSSEIKAGKEKNFKKGKNLRKDLSQILTVLREKEMIEKNSKAEKGKEEEK